MEQCTTYRARGKEIGLTFLFKYSLNGDLKAFEIAEGVLDDKQMSWLFSPRFPATERLIKNNWINNVELRTKFELTVSPADVSFEAFWKLYNLKVKREASEKAWNRLSEADKIKCFLALPRYEANLKLTGQAKAHLVTWINQKRYNDEY